MDERAAGGGGTARPLDVEIEDGTSRRSVWFGLAALVCGAGAMVSFWLWTVAVPLAVIALVLAVVSLRAGLRARSRARAAFGVFVTVLSTVALVLAIAFSGIFGFGAGPGLNEGPVPSHSPVVAG